jgi:hypothetical protein
LIARPVDFFHTLCYNQQKEKSMNVLFEQVRMQAQISRLLDSAGIEQAQAIVRRAWQIESRARQNKIDQPQANAVADIDCV